MLVSLLERYTSVVIFNDTYKLKIFCHFKSPKTLRILLRGTVPQAERFNIEQKKSALRFAGKFPI